MNKIDNYTNLFKITSNIPILIPDTSFSDFSLPYTSILLLIGCINIDKNVITSVRIQYIDVKMLIYFILDETEKKFIFIVIQNFFSIYLFQSSH